MRINEKRLRKIIMEEIGGFAPEKKKPISEKAIYKSIMQLKSCAEYALNNLPKPEPKYSNVKNNEPESGFSNPYTDRYKKAGGEVSRLCSAVIKNINRIISEYQISEPKELDRW